MIFIRLLNIILEILRWFEFNDLKKTFKTSKILH